MKDPYDTLGVERDADDAAITHAYRAEARKYHPDKGGTTADFQEVVSAYKLLRDRRHRAHYDKTGKDAPETDMEAEARVSLASLVRAFAENPGSDTINLLAEMKNALRSRRNEIDTRIRKTGEIATRARRMARRFKNKSGENILRRVLEEKAEMHEEEITTMRESIAVLELALRMLRDYSWEEEKYNAATHLRLYGS